MHIKTIKALILDMDGVIWRGEEPIGDLPSIFNHFDEIKLKIIFATNNSTLTIDDYINKLDTFGVKSEPWQILTSATATSEYLRAIHPRGGPVYIIGENGLKSALKENNFDHVDENALAVVVGLDREVDYKKLLSGSLLIQAGATFLGTNPDQTLPTPQGLAPGAGAIINALESATGVKAKIIGKPQTTMFTQALERLKTEPEETLVVGDRIETDIAGGQAAGCRTALVLSGVTNQEMAVTWTPLPDIILPDLSTLCEKL
ncbi:MAG: HAD-IIA family hydrolase [Chloroflexi bacterium]|nr:HAD-IIA family hydrolase [Chloroflexota bacterium]